MVKKIKKVIPLLLLMAPVLFAALPLFLPGFIPTHDGEYHLIRFYEFETMLRAGHWFPRWAPGLNSGYGIPLFNFFYPLPNYIGALFHSLGWQLTDAFKLTLATGYITAAIFCYLWLTKVYNRRAALVGSILFAYVPYWFVDLYVRGSVGEVLAIMCFIIFLASAEHRWAALTSISVAGIILSHNILSMVFVPLSVCYALLRHRRHILYILLGIGLSSYFWIPALFERGYVIGLNTVNFREHFVELFQLLLPSWGTGFSAIGIPYGEMSQQLGIVTIVVSIWAAILIFRGKQRRESRLLGGSLILLVLIVFFMLGISQPLWELLSPLQLLQFPWRLLSVVLPIAGLLTAYLISRLKGVLWAIVVVLAAFGFSCPYMRPVTYETRDDQYYLSQKEFTDGTSSLGNSFSTIWSPWKKERAKDKAEVIGGVGEIGEVSDEDPINMLLAISSEEKITVRVNIAYYPGWTVVVDGVKTAIDYQMDGLITFQIPAGVHKVRVFFGETALQNMANLLSLFSLLWIVLSGILVKARNYAEHYTELRGNSS